MAVDARYRGVLFDWRGTLFHDQSDVDWIRDSAAAIGRALSPDEIIGISAAIARADADPLMDAGGARRDASAAAHREHSMAVLALAGVDRELAEAIYLRDGSPDASFPYPDTPRVLRALGQSGVRVALISDIHYDLRPHFRRHGIDDCVDAWVLSFEQNVQKPEPRAFTIALELLAITAAEALMVGDSPSRDGGAVSVGITTLILPPVPDFSERGLAGALRLVGIEESSGR